MVININNIETEMPNLFIKEFDVSLLEGKAEVTFQHEEEGGSFSITPFDKLHANVYVFYENGGSIVFLTIGENTVLEVSIYGKGYTERTDENEVLGILHTVINEGFEETIWKIDDRVVKSVAKLIVRGETEPITIKCSSLFNPFAKKEVEVRRYLPYY